MITPEVIKYIKKKVTAGASPEAIRAELLKTGWKPADVEEAFRQTGLAGPTATPSDTSVADQQAPPVQTQGDGETATQAMPTSTSSGSNASAASDQAPTSQIPGYSDVGTKKSSKKRILALVVLLLLIIGGVAYGAYWYIERNPDPFTLFTEGMKATAGISSAAVITNVDLDMSAVTEVETEGAVEEVGMEFDYGIGFDGQYDVTDLQNVIVDGTLKIDVGGEAEGVSMTWGTLIDIKMVDQLLYLRLRDTEPFMFFDFSIFEDEWILIDATKVTPDVGLQEKILERFIREFSDDATVMSLKEGITLVGPENMQGVPTYHLVIQYPKETWRVIIEKYVDVLVDTMADEKMKELMSAEGLDGVDVETQIADAKEELLVLMNKPGFETFLEIMEEMRVDTWVGKQDSFMHKTTATLDVTDKIFQVDEGELRLDVSFNYGSELFNINEPVSTERPTNVTDLESIFDELAEDTYGDMISDIYMEDGEYLSSTTPEGGDPDMIIEIPQIELTEDEQNQAIKSHLNDISPLADTYMQLENVYGDKLELSPCPEYLGEEGENIFERDGLIAEHILETEVFSPSVQCAIGAQGTTYVVTAKLLDETSYCVDSLGFADIATRVKQDTGLGTVECSK